MGPKFDFLVGQTALLPANFCKGNRKNEYLLLGEKRNKVFYLNLQEICFLET
jgi:hypothetical protein